MRPEEQDITKLKTSAESRRVIEAQIQSATTGGGFVAIQFAETAIVAAVVACAAGVAVHAAAAALRVDQGAWQLAGMAALFAVPFMLVLTIHVGFLRRRRAA